MDATLFDLLHKKKNGDSMKLFFKNILASKNLVLSDYL